jgi:hypothetical protein
MEKMYSIKSGFPLDWVRVFYLNLLKGHKRKIILITIFCNWQDLKDFLESENRHYDRNDRMTVAASDKNKVYDNQNRKQI